MVVRRNDRRRRLMSDEYVPTHDDSSASTLDDSTEMLLAADAKTRRTYASGADRRNQLRTTDIFPKRTWLITALGILLVAIIALINSLAWYAPQWQSIIGVEGVAALSLRGTGTIASWFIGFTMFLGMMTSSQIYALRRHRCDDYVGTYRMWIWVPPLFAIASFAAVVDVWPIVLNVATYTTGLVINPESLMPMTVGLVVIALIAMRVLYEVRESKAAFALFAFAWLTMAISVTLQSPWLSSKIASSDFVLVLGNSYLLTAAALLTGLLFYTRFVYLHAHGLIVGRQQSTVKQHKELKATKKAAKRKAVAKPSAETKSEPAKVTGKEKAAAVATKPAKEKKRKKKAVAGNKPEQQRTSSAQPEPAAVSTQVKEEVKSNSTAAAGGGTMNSFKSLMEKRKSDKQNKTKAASPTQPVADTEEADSQQPATLKMTKAQRKRAKNKAQRRAA